MLHNVTDNKKHNHRILFLHSDLLASDFKKTRISTQPDFSSSSIPENYKIIKILHTISKISTRSSRTPQMTSGNPIQITHQISIPLNEENYQQRFPHWKTEVLTVLTELGLLNYLDGLAGFANHCLGYDDVLTAEQIWMKQDNHIRDWILTLLDPAIMSEEERLRHGKYSSSLWEHLTKKYTPIVHNPHQNSERQEIAEFLAKPYDPTEDKGLGEIAEFLAKPYDPTEDKGLGVPVVPFQPPIVHNPGQNSSGFAPLSQRRIVHNPGQNSNLFAGQAQYAPLSQPHIVHHPSQYSSLFAGRAQYAPVSQPRIVHNPDQNSNLFAGRAQYAPLSQPHIVHHPSQYSNLFAGRAQYAPVSQPRIVHLLGQYSSLFTGRAQYAPLLSQPWIVHNPGQNASLFSGRAQYAPLSQTPMVRHPGQYSSLLPGQAQPDPNQPPTTLIPLQTRDPAAGGQVVIISDDEEDED